MTTAAWKRKERAREALMKAIVWALACGITAEEICALARKRTQ